MGRINRIGTKVFDELHINNIFPTEQGASQVKIREIAEQKMFLIHNALGEDAKILNPDEEPTASGLFNKVNTNPDEVDELNILTIVRNELNKIKEEHPATLEKISEFPNRTKTAKISKERNTVVLRKKGMALFSIIANYNMDKTVISEKTFKELFDLVKCSFNEKRLPLSKQFWTAYEKIKSYKPQYKSGRSEISLEKIATNSLKTLLKQKKDELDQPLISFIDTLLKDIKRYKTLPEYTLRNLVLPENSGNNPFDELTANIENLRRKIGSDYLDIILKRTSAIDHDIIIAVENKKEEKYSA